MIKIENMDIWGFENASRAMRNPMNSWHLNDTEEHPVFDGDRFLGSISHVGDNDLDLMKRLSNAGVEHRTFARMIMISMDITAPLYWWKEADRYRFKEQISTSTMHKIHAKEFTLDDFSWEHLNVYSAQTLQMIVQDMNVAREAYLKSKSKDDWWQMIQLLPTSYNQRRTVMMSYETAMKMIKERKNHKLDEWRNLVALLEDLPYMRELL